MSSSSSEQSPAFPVALCTFGHFLEEMGRPQVLHNFCTNGSFSRHKHILAGALALLSPQPPDSSVHLFKSSIKPELFFEYL